MGHAEKYVITTYTEVFLLRRHRLFLKHMFWVNQISHFKKGSIFGGPKSLFFDTRVPNSNSKNILTQRCSNFGSQLCLDEE